MKWNVAAILALTVVGGSVLAYQQSQITELRSREVPGVERAPSGAGDRETSVRLELLEDRVARLTRVALVEQPGVAATSPAQTTPAEEELTELRADMDALVMDRSLDSEAGRQRLRRALRKEQEAMQEERREERWERMRAERDARMAKFTQDAQLDPGQVEQLTASVEQEGEYLRELFQTARAGDKPFFEAREEARAIRDSTDETMRDVLSSSQYEKYSTYREETGFGGRRRSQR